MTPSAPPPAFVPFAYPDLRDPRVMLCIPVARRDAMTSLWALVERLLTIVATAREPMLAQIKLAWWRDMLVRLAQAPDDLPVGEPLLAQLRRDWGGVGDLAPLATAVETLLLAEDDARAAEAAIGLGARVFGLSRGRDTDSEAPGACWGLVVAALTQPGTARAAALLAQASRQPRSAGGGKGTGRALHMLDLWASQIARRGGERSQRSEAMLLLRIGIFGR